MFTGILQDQALVKTCSLSKNRLDYSIECSPEILHELQIGASVSINGVCQSVVNIENRCVHFQAIHETLKRTTLSKLEIGDSVHVERSARIGDEIGGHMLSGHVMGTAKVEKVENDSNIFVLYLSCPQNWMSYIFEKGFIAIDGASLTVVDVFEEGGFTVHLIPETLKRTHFSKLSSGDRVNIEIDSMTQTIVNTVQKVLLRNL